MWGRGHANTYISTTYINICQTSVTEIQNKTKYKIVLTQKFLNTLNKIFTL